MPSAAETFLILLVSAVVISSYRLTQLGDLLGAAGRRALGRKRD